MPELPEVEAVRRELEPVMRGARIERVALGRRDLRTRFPRRFAVRLEGCTVLAVNRRAKYLLVALSSGETLIMHLGMSGSFRTEASGTLAPTRHDHVIFHLSNGSAVVYNDPRRFGFMDLVREGELATHPAISGLGPEPLSDDFDAVRLARASARKKTTLKAALLDQRVVAGLGNIYVSEALHVAGLSPRRRASTIATPSGSPRRAANELAAAIKLVLKQAVERAAYREGGFRVYDREGERCRRRGCGGVIERRTQGGRSTFYCRSCQR